MGPRVPAVPRVGIGGWVSGGAPSEDPFPEGRPGGGGSRAGPCARPPLPSQLVPPVSPAARHPQGPAAPAWRDVLVLSSPGGVWARPSSQLCSSPAARYSPEETTPWSWAPRGCPHGLCPGRVLLAPEGSWCRPGSAVLPAASDPEAPEWSFLADVASGVSSQRGALRPGPAHGVHPWSAQGPGTHPDLEGAGLSWVSRPSELEEASARRGNRPGL